MAMLPLIFIGVVLGLLVFGKSLDFFAMLGLLGLIGMNIKNAIVLVDEIGLQMDSGLAPVNACYRGNQDTYRSCNDGLGYNDSGYASVAGRRDVCRYGRNDHGRFVCLNHPDHLRASGYLLYFL